MKKENEIIGPLVNLNYIPNSNYANSSNPMYLNWTGATTSVLSNLSSLRSTNSGTQTTYQTASNYYTASATGANTGPAGSGTGTYFAFNTNCVNSWLNDAAQSDFLTYLDTTVSTYQDLLGWYVRGVLMLQGQQQGTTDSAIQTGLNVRLLYDVTSGNTATTAFDTTTTTGTALGSTQAMLFSGNAYQ